MIVVKVKADIFLYTTSNNKRDYKLRLLTKLKF